MPFHLLIIGFDEIVDNKYFECVLEAIDAGFVTDYSVIDLEGAREDVLHRLGELKIPPREVTFLEESDGVVDLSQFRQTVTCLQSSHRRIRAYIATEVRAHEAYLRHCIIENIPSLVEKPVLAPMEDGHFEPAKLQPSFSRLLHSASDQVNQHSVMTLSRYHRIYNGRYIDYLAKKVEDWQAPISSLHLRHSGGVWNLHHEYEERDDHPYKYGYGMMMHGAYHYVDLAAQLLKLNRRVLPSKKFCFHATSFAAYPPDQSARISDPAASLLGDDSSDWARSHPNPDIFGETDLVSVFRVTDETGRVIVLGSLAFEQTTPSIRNWSTIPPGLYNKNGRTSMVDIEVQLSTLHSSHVRVYDVPVSHNETGEMEVDRIDAFARIDRRTNAALLPDTAFVERESHDGLFHSDSNKALMRHWLREEEENSQLDSHQLTVRITQALLEAAVEPGKVASFGF